jgi:hypothetical protein
MPDQIAAVREALHDVGHATPGRQKRAVWRREAVRPTASEVASNHHPFSPTVESAVPMPKPAFPDKSRGYPEGLGGKIGKASFFLLFQYFKVTR